MKNTTMPHLGSHFVNGNPVQGPFDTHLHQAIFAMGCFWGAERLFWQTEGVFSTAAGYAGGDVADPDYHAVCGGETGHAEVVLVIYDPAEVSYPHLLKLFWESHDPTQGMRQGNDIGSQYRSAIFAVNDTQYDAALHSMAAYQTDLTAAGRGEITTQVATLDIFYYAEDYHQQYLAKNPGGYCGLSGTGVSCQVGLDLDQKTA